MDNKQTPTLDQSKLTPEQRNQLETYQQAQDQLQALEDIAKMTQEVIGILDDKKGMDNIGTLLVDIRESLVALKDKEATEMPDYAKPVVEAVSKLEKALSASIQAIDVNPNVSVAAPNVSVAAPKIDLSGVETAVKALPKVFQDAIAAIPETPETDFAPLLEAWSGISEQLVSIENATRMKPQPGSMTISNLSGVTTPLETIAARSAYMQFDADDSAPIYIGCHADVTAADTNTAWTIYKFTYTGANVTSWKKRTGAWSQRVALFS